MRNTIFFCVILFYIFHNVKSKKQHTRDLNPDSAKGKHRDKINITKFVDMLIRDAKRIARKQNENGTPSDPKTVERKEYGTPSEQKTVERKKNGMPSVPNLKRKKQKRQRQTTTKMEMTTEKDGFESNYDTLDVNEETKGEIVRSHKEEKDLERIGQIIKSENEGVDLDELQHILRSNNAGTDYEKMGQLLRQSNAGIDYKKRGHVVRSKDDSRKTVRKSEKFRSVDRPSEEEGAELLFDLEKDDDGVALPLF